jgi:hypothetical protein
MNAFGAEFPLRNAACRPGHDFSWNRKRLFSLDPKHHVASCPLGEREGCHYLPPQSEPGYHQPALSLMAITFPNRATATILRSSPQTWAPNAVTFAYTVQREGLMWRQTWSKKRVFLLAFWLKQAELNAAQQSSYVELGPSWIAASCAATHELPNILWKPSVHCRVRKSPPLAPTLGQISQVHTFPIDLFKIRFNIYSSTGVLLFLVVSFLLAFQTKPYKHSSDHLSLLGLIIPCLSFPITIYCSSILLNCVYTTY